MRVVALAKHTPGRAKAPVLVLRYARCGRARRHALRAPVRVRRTRTLVARVPTASPGDYRVVAELREGRTVLARRTRFVRVRGGAQPQAAVVILPVRFSVTNVNRSKLACVSDGQPYEVRGRLVAPQAALARAQPSVTLYLHEFGWGRFFWQFPDGAWDYAGAEARAGHASLVIDRIGYGESSHPPGNGTCLGSQADVAHQLVVALRAGSYDTTGRRSVAFGRVALAGHSGGGAIAELEAYSFRDVDSLLLFAYADNDFTNASIAAADQQGQVCATGGDPAEPGYAYFAQTADEWKSFMFTSARPAVADRAAAMRNRDPCGDSSSLSPTVVSNQANVAQIDVPVLLLYGTHDAVYNEPAAGQDQQKLFSGSHDVTLRYFANTGHALTLEASAPAMRAVVAGWLTRHGL